MKDILIMCQFFYPEQVSSSLLPFQTAEKMVEDGFNVSVLCGMPKEYNLDDSKKIPKKEKVSGINIQRINYLKLGKKGKLSRLVNYFSFIISMFLKVGKCRNTKSIIVYSNPPLLPVVAILANKLFKTKIIFVSYDVYPEIAIELGVLSGNGLISKVTRKINKKLFDNASKIVVLSKDMKDFYINNKEVPENKISVIENWATEEYQVDSVIKSNSFKLIRKNYDVIVTYLGNMGKAQDIETILDCAKKESIKSNSIAFIFAGRGEKKEYIINQKEIYGLDNLFVFDYLVNEDLNDLLNISDMFIVSLEKGIEGLAVPSKTYSYYQAQKPIIAIMDRNTQIFKEVENNSIGFAITNNDIDKFESNLLEVVHSENFLDTQKNNMKIFSKKYNEKKQLEKYTKLMQEILGE